jgi:HEAT repeat protein
LVSWSAGRALARIDPGERAVLDRFIKDLNSGDLEKRYNAAEFLMLMGPAAKPAVGPLLDALSDRDAEIRRRVIAALKKIDPAAAKRAGVPGIK